MASLAGKRSRVGGDDGDGSDNDDEAASPAPTAMPRNGDDPGDGSNIVVEAGAAPRLSSAAFALADTMTVSDALPAPGFVAPAAKLALVMIDFQRDFLEEGGFASSLGNDVALLQPSLAPAKAMLAAARAAGLTVIHTIECHAPDLSDLPPSKVVRCTAVGQIKDPARGRVLVRGEPGNAIVAELTPVAGELVVHKPGKGAFWATGLHAQLLALEITHLLFAGVTTEISQRLGSVETCQGMDVLLNISVETCQGMRADDHARGQRSRLRMLARD